MRNCFLQLIAVSYGKLSVVKNELLAVMERFRKFVFYLYNGKLTQETNHNYAPYYPKTVENCESHVMMRNLSVEATRDKEFQVKGCQSAPKV